jgi:hypothetical protein
MKNSIFWNITSHNLLKVKQAASRVLLSPSSWFHVRLILRPSRHYIIPKRRLALNGLHGVISQKIELFITTGVRTSNPTFV